MKISVSDVSTFLRCRRLWDFSSPNRRNYEPQGKSTPLAFGSAVHEALEHYYRANSNLLDTFDEYYARMADGDLDDRAREEKEKMVLLGRAVLARYQLEYGIRPNPDATGMCVLVTEQEFDVPIQAIDHFADERASAEPAQAGRFVGTMDGLCRDENGHVWVFETKTYSRQPTTTALLLNLQQVGYTAAAQALSDMGKLTGLGIARGTRVHGVCYNGIRKALPSSRSKPDTVYFQREYIERTRDELTAFWANLEAIHWDMATEPVELYPTMTQDCAWSCAYREPCMAMNRMDDGLWLLEHMYKQRPQRGKVYPLAVVEAEE